MRVVHDISFNFRPVTSFVPDFLAVAANREPPRHRFNARQHFLETLEQSFSLLFCPMPLETHLDRYSEVRGPEGLENVTIGLGELSPLEHGTVTVAADINQRKTGNGFI